MLTKDALYCISVHIRTKADFLSMALVCRATAANARVLREQKDAEFNFIEFHPCCVGEVERWIGQYTSGEVGPGHCFMRFFSHAGYVMYGLRSGMCFKCNLRGVLSILRDKGQHHDPSYDMMFHTHPKPAAYLIYREDKGQVWQWHLKLYQCILSELERVCAYLETKNSGSK